MTAITIGAGSDVLALGVSEDPYQGDAQFTVSVDGQQVGGVLTATSLHSGTSSDVVDVLGNWAPGNHVVTLNFLNDAWGGSADTDRNLYLDGATYNGAFVPRVAQELQVSGPISFGVADSLPTLPSTTTTVGSGSDTLVLKVSQDAYLGNAQFVVSLDGQQVGDVLTASSLHSDGTSDTVNVLANLSPGQHTVAVNFFNDTFGGTSDTDRNLYIDSATYDGAVVDGAAQTLYSSGLATFSITDTTPAPGSSVVVAAGATATAGGDQLAGVNVILAGAFGNPANLTLNAATVGSLTVADNDLTNGSSVYYGRLDAYGQSAIAGATVIGGSRPVAPGFVDAYVHGSDGVLTLNGASLGGGSTLTINGDEGATVENDGDIRIQGGTVTGRVTILTDLEGTGTISGARDVTGTFAGVRLGGEVGAGQTINLTQTNLTLDQPMEFAGTLTGFSSDGSISGGNRAGLTLGNETITAVSFAQSSSNAGDLFVLTQDPSTGAAAATLDFHVAGTYAPDAFAFTNNAAVGSAKITLA